MIEIKIEPASEKDFLYIKKKLSKYLLDADNAKWEDFSVAKSTDKTVGFARLIDHKEYFEVASLGVDYYHRKKGIGTKLVKYLVEKAKHIDQGKPIYAVSHIPDFLKKLDFRETTELPAILEQKKTQKCKIYPERSRILKFSV